MKQIKYNIAYLLGWCFLFYGCDEWDTPTYEAEHEYLQFNTPYQDSTSFTFKKYPGKGSINYPIVVTISGNALEEDLEYVITEDTKQSTALRNTHFELPESALFRKGLFQDTCWITLHKTGDMKDLEKRLVLQIKANENFMLGQDIYTQKIIRISDRITKPDWWDGSMDYYYLGEYSDKKYEMFILATGLSDLSDAKDDQIRYYALLFKRWLEKNPQTEEDGSSMSVTVVG